MSIRGQQLHEMCARHESVCVRDGSLKATLLMMVIAPLSLSSMNDIRVGQTKNELGQRVSHPCASRYHAMETNTKVNADMSTVTHTMRLKSERNSGRYNSAPGSIDDERNTRAHTHTHTCDATLNTQIKMHTHQYITAKRLMAMLAQSDAGTWRSECALDYLLKRQCTRLPFAKCSASHTSSLWAPSRG